MMKADNGPHQPSIRVSVCIPRNMAVPQVLQNTPWWRRNRIITIMPWWPRTLTRAAGPAPHTWRRGTTGAGAGTAPGGPYQQGLRRRSNNR